MEWSFDKISPEFLTDQNKLRPEFSYTFLQYLLTCDLISVRQLVKHLEILVVVVLVALDINRVLYGFL